MNEINRHLCRCGCGEYVKSKTAKYILGHCNRDPDVKEKKRKTSIKNYGTSNPMQSEKIQLKSKKSMIDKYGVPHNSQLKEVIQKRIDTHKNRTVAELSLERCNRSRSAKISYNKNGVMIKKKCKETSLSKYGVDNVAKSHKIRKKISESLKSFSQEKINNINEKRKSTCIKHFGVDNYAKTDEGRLISRITRIRLAELQIKNGEPVMPTVGYKERPFLNELQKHTKYKIVRQNPRYDIARFPDGFIPELKLFILYDEPFHFVDWDCTIYNETSLLETCDYESLDGYTLIRISEKDWEKRKQQTIEEFKQLIHQLKSN